MDLSHGLVTSSTCRCPRKPCSSEALILSLYRRHINLFTLNWEALGSGLTSFGGLQPATETLLTITWQTSSGSGNYRLRAIVHHVHAFTIHVTALILLKGLLFARGSRLVPDKARLGFRFPCDGPGRGGTCQVSAWDHTLRLPACCLTRRPLSWRAYRCGLTRLRRRVLHVWQLNWHSCDGCPEMLYGLCCLYSIGAIAFYWQARLPCIRGLELFRYR